MGRAYCSGVALMVRTLEETVEWSCLWQRGPDAVSYAQGQLTQDVGTPSAHDRTALLEPDGTVIVAGLLRVTEEAVGVVVPREHLDTALARLRRFRLRARVEFIVEDVAQSPWPRWIDLVRDLWPGPLELAGALSPASYGASFVSRAVSLTKGCYTGQELVARLDARGARVPFRMVRVGVADPDVLEELDASLRRGPAGPTGLTTVVATPSGAEALGFAHRSWTVPETMAESVLDTTSAG